MVQHVEGTSNVTNFCVYAVMLDALIAKSLRLAYEKKIHQETKEKVNETHPTNQQIVSTKCI